MAGARASRSGGKEAEVLLASALERGVEMLDACSSLTPRRERQEMLALCERAEGCKERPEGGVRPEAEAMARANLARALCAQATGTLPLALRLA